MPAKSRKAGARKAARPRVPRAPSARSTNSSRLRLPSARELASLVRELEAVEAAGGESVLALPTGTLTVSSLDKVFFPDGGQTKGALMRYYVRVAREILPAIADRPLVMKRYPNGVAGKAFYQQRAPADAPGSVRVQRVSDVGMTPQNKLIGGDLATLLYLVQLGAISVDPWHSRVQSVTTADFAIIDLDPGPKASFARVVDVAVAVHEELDALGLRAVPKTSGASGIHIVLPLPEGVPNDGARMIAELVATRVADAYPRIATIERSVGERRPGTVYVDFLQNIRGKTVAGVYSARATPEATVSTPLRWDEVAKGLDPRDFTIDNVPERIREVGDLWGECMRTPNSLDSLGGRQNG